MSSSTAGAAAARHDGAAGADAATGSKSPSARAANPIPFPWSQPATAARRRRAGLRSQRMDAYRHAPMDLKRNRASDVHESCRQGWMDLQSWPRHALAPTRCPPSPRRTRSHRLCSVASTMRSGERPGSASTTALRAPSRAAADRRRRRLRQDQDAGARVAHLSLAGADPQRILLLTFSRRAAREMERRVGRVLHGRSACAGDAAAAAPAVGRHLPQRRRAPAARVRGARSAWTTVVHHPRPRRLRGPDGPACATNSAWRPTQKRFPLKGTCLAIYSRVVNSREPLAEVLRRDLPVVRASGRTSSSGCSAPTSRPSRRRTCSTTTTCCSSGPR